MSLESFARDLLKISLRPYQLEAAQAVIESIRAGAGRSIVIMFSRQSGKDELSANLKAYLLVRLRRTETGIVEVNPTYKPQTINAIERLEDRLCRSSLTRRRWRKRSDFMRIVGRARVSFLSGEAKANVVGAVASTLLIVNEAQDVAPAVYDRHFAPMAASTNATRLFMGTAWTSHTLLARELRAARQAEQADGIRRLFVYDADDVRKMVPAYGTYVDEQIARLGRGHPLIKTQYFNEEIDAEGSMFTPARRAMMQCDISSALPPPNAAGIPDDHSARLAFGGGAQRAEGVAESNRLPCIFSVDVAGQDEAAFHNPEQQLLNNPARDSVTLTIATVEPNSPASFNGPIFRVVRREQWTGLNHLTVFARIRALADSWSPRYLIIDATGVGEGLWAMLDRQYPTRVIPVKFSVQKKSELGYRFLAMIETGRFKDCSGERTSSPHRPPRSPGGPGPHVVAQSWCNARASEAKSWRSSRARRAQPDDREASLREAVPLKDLSEHVVARRAQPDDREASLREAIPLSPSQPSSSITPPMVDRQYAACISEVLLGPQRTMRWGVPEGARDENGTLIHDDIVMADALLAEADMLDWTIRSETFIIPGKDPLDEMSHF